MSRRGKGRPLLWSRDNYWQSANYNSRLFTMLHDEIVGMALTRFKWINLPEGCDERYLEMTLLSQGIATIARPLKTIGDMEIAGTWRSLMVSGWEQAPDMYGNPTRWQALGMNGYTFRVSPVNGYFVWDNHQRTPIFDRIDLWARELVDILRTMQQNRVHQKIPMIITGAQEKQLDKINYLKQVAGGELAVIANDDFSSVDVKAITDDVPYIGVELFEQYKNVWMEIYRGLGIDNLTEKAERLTNDEIAAQAEPSDLLALDELECRRAACRYLNKHFDEFAAKPLDVVWRQDNNSDNYNVLHNVKDFKEMEGGDSDGTDR